MPSVSLSRRDLRFFNAFPRLRINHYEGVIRATNLRDRARELRDRILAGEVPFEKAASDDATLQDDADWIETGSLGAPIRDALRPLSPGGLSEPVEVDGSLYLVQLVDHQPARIRSVEEVAPQIEKELRKAEFTRLNRIWIDSLRSKYYIQTFTHALFE